MRRHAPARGRDELVASLPGRSSTAARPGPLPGLRQGELLGVLRRADSGSRRHLVGELQRWHGNAGVVRILAGETAVARRRAEAEVAPHVSAREVAPPDVPSPDDAVELEELPTPTTSGTTIARADTTYAVSGSFVDVANAIAVRTEAGSVTSQFSDIYLYPDSDPITLANITVTETKMLPTWTDRATGTDAEKAEWDRFRAALDAHENGHIAIDTTRFTDIHRRVLRQTHTRADEIITEAETAATAENDAYDERTDHGRNTGTTITIPAGSRSAAPAPAPVPEAAR